MASGNLAFDGWPSEGSTATKLHALCSELEGANKHNWAVSLCNNYLSALGISRLNSTPKCLDEIARSLRHPELAQLSEQVRDIVDAMTVALVIAQDDWLLAPEVSSHGHQDEIEVSASISLEDVAGPP
ncbi:MAG: hypothetical protein ACYDEY_05255 [Acidimicrobiales bacterium]